VREFLARKQVPHQFHDVRKQPVGTAEALALVRRHRRGLSRRGGKVVEVEIGAASDEELRKLFVGREGGLRAPTVSDGATLLAGFDEVALRELTGG
jgi:arsenate reductase-like glutaredoxin family protein